MQFLHPLALWGVLLVAVPIIIHLITRRKALRKPFAAIQFILLSYQKQKRKLRLKRILILLARILIVALLALLIARPSVMIRGSSMNLDSSSRSIVILIDNTMSMSQGGDKSPFVKAIKLARSIIESLGTEQESAVMAVAPERVEKKEGMSLSADPAPLLKTLESIQISYGHHSLQEALISAIEVVKRGAYEPKQVLLITDLQKSAWEFSTNFSNSGVDLLVLDVGAEGDTSNLALSDLALKPAVGEARYEAKVEIRAYSKEPMNGRELVVNVNGEERARTFVDIPAGGAIAKELIFSSVGGALLLGTVKIPPDALEADNVRYFTARSSGRLNALVVDGDPRPERYGAETYYLMNALNPRLEARSRIEPTMMTVAQFEETSLKGYDLVILANVGSVRGKTTLALKEFVKEGGALLFSLGDQIDPATFQSSFGELVPAPIYILKEAPQGEGFHLDAFRDSHPATEIFRKADGGDLSLPTFTKYFMVDLSASSDGARRILSFNDGAPALIEKGIGKGKTALWTSTLDRDWNNMCIYPTYLPLLQQLAIYLTGGALLETNSSGYTAEADVVFECSATSMSAIVQTPSDKLIEVMLTTSEDGKGGVFRPQEMGFYKLFCVKEGEKKLSGDKEPDKVIAVNVDTRESNLERWEVSKLKEFLAQQGLENTAVGRNFSELASGGGFKEGRKEIWESIIFVMFVIILFEAFLTRKG